jgi:hypothetical protein
MFYLKEIQIFKNIIKSDLKEIIELSSTYKK